MCPATRRSVYDAGVPVTRGSPAPRPFPYASLPRRSRREAALETAVARWLAARPDAWGWRSLAGLLGGAPDVRALGVVGADAIAPDAAWAELRVGGLALGVAGSGAFVRALAQRLLGGPAELAAPRPPTPIEHALWAAVVAAAVVDLGIPGEVWPTLDPPAAPATAAARLGLAAEVAHGELTAVVVVPGELVVRPPPARPLPGWRFALPVVVARALLPRDTVGRLRVRDVVVVEAALALDLGPGTIGLRAAPGAIEAEVATGYVPRAMPGPDEAHLELVVQLAAVSRSLRELGELAVGQVVPLGRPLAGPYEICVAGQRVGQGELVDVDGELGVRIVSLRAPA